MPTAAVAPAPGSASMAVGTSAAGAAGVGATGTRARFGVHGVVKDSDKEGKEEGGTQRNVLMAQAMAAADGQDQQACVSQFSNSQPNADVDDEGFDSGEESDWDDSRLFPDQVRKLDELASTFQPKPSPMRSAAFLLATRHGVARDLAPMFSSSNRPWDVKPPLQAHPQYRQGLSSIGKQALSQSRSEAGAAFSTATRDQDRLVYISHRHSLAQPSLKSSPGPDYQYPSMLGRQMLSTRRSAGTPPFTAAGRPSTHLLYAERGGGRRHLTATGARPATTHGAWIATRDQVDVKYGTPVSSMGPAIWRGASPCFSFGAAKRKPWTAETAGPGPIYAMPSSWHAAPAPRMRQPLSSFHRQSKSPFTTDPRSSLGTQTVSRCRSAPSFGFGTSSRGSRSKQFLMTDAVAATRNFGATARQYRNRHLAAARAHVRRNK